MIPSNFSRGPRVSKFLSDSPVAAPAALFKSTNAPFAVLNTFLTPLRSTAGTKPFIGLPLPMIDIEFGGLTAYCAIFFAVASLPFAFAPIPVSNTDAPIAHDSSPSQNRSIKSPTLLSKFCILSFAPLIAPVTPFNTPSALVMLSINFFIISPRKF